MTRLPAAVALVVALVGPAAAAKKAVAVPAEAAAPEAPRPRVDCADPAAIRAFKDTVWMTGWGSKEESWAGCLCGEKLAAKAGVNPVRPPLPRSAPAWRRYTDGDVEAARQFAVKWFFTHLKLNPEDSAAIAVCLYPDR